MKRVSASARSLPGRLFPRLDEWLWNRERDRWCREQVSARAYDELNEWKFDDQDPNSVRVVIVPMDGPDVPTWQVAGGNHFYEIWQSARELFGENNVDMFAVGSDESTASWHIRLIRHLQSSGATHVVFQAEHDPNQPNSYSWDLFLMQACTHWGGVFLGVMYDSAFVWITTSARRLARFSDHFVLVDICQPMNGRLVSGREEASIVTMAISDQTVNAVDEYVEGMSKEYPVSVIGALYPERVEMLQTIRNSGIDVAVNPHRPDATSNFVESRTNQPTYLDYMAGLYRSRMTINLSASSSGNGQQLKTRVLEASLMGTVVLTDDVDRTGRFWRSGEEYVPFSSVISLSARIAELESLPERQAQIGQLARARARELNVMGFWGGIDKGLKARGLQPLIGAPD